MVRLPVWRRLESSPSRRRIAPFHSRRHRWFAAAFAFAAGVCAMSAVGSASAQTETLVFVRHGEKPAKGYGQLNCQGLNRAMALPAVIAAKFGKPSAIYAPNPSIQKRDAGVLYDYVRPLATIEPTAIEFGLPVNTDYGYSSIEALEQELVNPNLAGKLIVTAWEHAQIEALARKILRQYGDGTPKVPYWPSSDFDSIYIVKLDWSAQGTAPRATFTLDHEGLNGRSSDCPCAALPETPTAAASQ